MANQIVTTAVNYDDSSISGLLNGETITINGGSVTVDADVRWNQQAAVFGAVTLSATLGGSFLVDGTKVWEVPFSASSGNVPTQAALGSNGVTGGTSGATGELTRVWATGSLTPATAGSAMPATGFIKLRSKTGDFQSGETITLPGGATVTASGAGKRSWIHVVGRGGPANAGGQTLTASRLNDVEFEGDWYEIGTTNGADGQTFQFPVLDVCPAIWIETAPASGIYEIWINADTRWTAGAIATSDKRGMYFGFNEATGVITIADRIGNTAGFKPPSGCRVRIPNIILSQADGVTPNYNINVKPTGLNGRYSFSVTSNSLTLRNVSCNWRMILGAFALNFQDSSFLNPLQITSVATTATVTNCGIATLANTGAVHALTFNAGVGTFTDVFFCRGSNSSLRAINVTNTDRLTFTRCRAGSTLPSVTQLITLSGRNITMTDCVAVGGPGIDDLSTNVKIINFKGCLPTIGTSQSSWIWPIVDMRGTDGILDGFSWFENLSNVGPTNYPFYLRGTNNEARNIGTPTAPLNLGTIFPPTNGIFGGPSGLTMRRIYLTGMTTRLAQFTTASNVYSFNVWGDNDKSYEVYANNSISRGGRFTQSVITSPYANIYGQHWNDAWTSSTAGQITILCTEPTDETADQCEFTLDRSVSSGFTSACGVAMNTLTDEVIWTMPYYAIGVTGFANSAPLLTGTNTANISLMFQFDIGSGFNGTWLDLTGANLSAITVTPATGVRLKVRARLVTATNSVLNFVRIATTATEESQRLEYPLPGSLLTINNLIPNSRVKVSRVDTGAFLLQGSTAGTSLTLDIQYSGAIRVEARNASGVTTYKPWVTSLDVTQGQSFTAIALQEED